MPDLPPLSTWSNHGWDGGCWIVLDRDCEPVSDYHHLTEASAHATAHPVGYYVRRMICTVHTAAYVFGLDTPTED